MDNFSTLVLLFALACTAAGFYYLLPAKSPYPLPPDPTVSWFGLGRGINMPQTHSWLTFAKWQEKYGDLIFVNAFKNPILVVNSTEAAQDLLDKSSLIYPSRPVRTMQADLIGFTYLFCSIPYDSWYKKNRSMFHTYFQPKALPRYCGLRVKHTRALLRNLLNSTNTLEYDIRRATTSIILEVCYGHHVAEQSDEYISLANNALAGIIKSGNFGTYMVDYLPILKYVPEWMPGAGFKRQAREWREFSQRMLDFPVDMVKQKMENGTAEPCFVTNELEDWFRSGAKDGVNQEALIKGSSATAFAAGSDTTMSALISFILAMMLYPEIQEQARAEIDHVIPKDRLPQYSDKENLHFIHCIVWECLRWNAPISIAAHYSVEDDVYKGFYIPKGTTVLANMWLMLHDPARYPEPMRFNPNRYMDADKNAVNNINPVPEITFGFGRRKVSPLLICPGRAFALDTIWLLIASIVSVYEILKPVDEFGREIEPEIEYSSGLVSHSKPFKYHMKPRSAEAEALIEQTKNEI